MKEKLITLLCLLTITLWSNAQKLSIESFSERTSDLSARKYSRMDNNDVPCALVKVQLASPNAVFEGAIMGDIQYKTSEYWVYMPKSSKRLTVKLEGYLPLPVEFEPLESNVTYILTISGVIVQGQLQEVRTQTGWIILDSEPQGAAVYINDEFVGNTPLDSYKQPYGTYSYRLDMPNYHHAEGIVELNSSQFEQTVILKPAFGSISVTGNVQGAMVLLDGKDTGKKTPCTLTEISSGPHIVALQKNKYAPMQYNVLVEDGKESTVSGNLDARFATITINTIQDAEILIDNTYKGTTSLKSDLMEGYYDIEVRLTHHKPITKQIQVVAGQPQTVEVRPTPIYGSLDITSTPRGADVKIDGKEYGKTPMSVEKLLEGEHTIEYTLAGYAKEIKQVSISEGQIATSSVAMSIVNESYARKFAEEYEPESWNYKYFIAEKEHRRSIPETTKLDTKSVSNMSEMFYGCHKLERIDISNFNTKNVTNMSGMFHGCIKLLSIDLKSFNTPNVITFRSMFKNCKSLTSLNLANFDNSNVTDMSNMFEGCVNLRSIELNGFNTTNVTNMSEMFSYCESLNSLNLSSFNTSNVINMGKMFINCGNLTYLQLSNFNTSKVTNMSDMFRGCRKLASIDVTNFNTSNVTDMSGMFELCLEVKLLNVSKFRTSNVTNMSGMFSDCSKITSLDLRNFNTDKVTNMNGMFKDCWELTSLEVTNFNTSNVTNMSCMFMRCKKLTSLDLSNFNTSNVTAMMGMFEESSNLVTLDLSNFDTSKVRYIGAMFIGCKKLRTIKVTNCNQATIDKIKEALSEAGLLNQVRLVR